jgi:hypothetical protein
LASSLRPKTTGGCSRCSPICVRHSRTRRFRDDDRASSEGIEDRRILSEGACAFFRTASLAAAATLVDAISQLADVDDHQVDVDVRRGGVTVRLITYTDDYMGMSQRDGDDFAPAWWTLADAAGNEADVATSMSRD